MRIKRFLLLLFIPTASYAALPTWTESINVTAVEVHDNAVFFQVSPYSEPCGGSTWVKFTGNAELEKRAITGGITALTADKKIKVYGVSCELKGSDRIFIDQL